MALPMDSVIQKKPQPQESSVSRDSERHYSEEHFLDIDIIQGSGRVHVLWAGPCDLEHILATIFVATEDLASPTI